MVYWEAANILHGINQFFHPECLELSEAEEAVERAKRAKQEIADAKARAWDRFCENWIPTLVAIGIVVGLIVWIGSCLYSASYRSRMSFVLESKKITCNQRRHGNPGIRFEDVPACQEALQLQRELGGRGCQTRR